IRAGGGFSAQNIGSSMIGQVQLWDVPNPERAAKAVEAAKGSLLEQGAEAVPNLVKRGGGPSDLEVRDLGEGLVVVHVRVDCRDAMGANLVNTVAEALAPRLRELCGGKLGLRIL